MLLYDADKAPSPRRVRIMLAEKGIAVERRRVDLRAGEQLGPDYLAINPRGVVPALVIPGEAEALTESGAICRYLEALYPDPPMFGRTPIETGRVEEWTRRIEAEGYAAAVYVFRNTHPVFVDRAAPGPAPVPQIEELADRAQLMWAGFVAALDARLAGRTWIATGDYCFADATALVTIDFARAARLTIPDGCAALAAWRARAAARPSAAA